MDGRRAFGRKLAAGMGMAAGIGLGIAISIAWVIPYPPSAGPKPIPPVILPETVARVEAQAPPEPPPAVAAEELDPPPMNPALRTLNRMGSSRLGLRPVTMPVDWGSRLPRIEDIKPEALPELPDEPPHEGALIDVPYRAQPPDLLRIEVLEALPGRPITGLRLVRPDGTISLGYYGDVHVRGLSMVQIKTKVLLHLRRLMTDEALGLFVDEGSNWHTSSLPDLPPEVSLFDPEVAGPPEGNRAETPAGRMDREGTPPPSQPYPAERGRGRSSPDPARPIDSHGVSVDVASYNSRMFYLLGAFEKPGRLPYTGDETVLDVIQFAGGLTAKADASTLRIVRPAWGKKPMQVLKVDLDAILDRGDPKANYQILPGDRLLVDADAAAKFRTLLGYRIADDPR